MTQNSPLMRVSRVATILSHRRQGYKGWMVYDRQQKGPALIGTDLAVNLTREQASHIQQKLTESDRKQSRS